MSNQPKKKGTQFETSCVNYVRAVAGVECERVALHGSRDEGDLRMVTHGREFAVECKAVERMGEATLAQFRLQATVEAQNAGAAGGILVTWRRGKGYRWDASPTGQRAKSFGENLAHMTLETALMVAGATGDVAMPDRAADTWVTMSLSDLAIMAREWSE